MLFKRVVDKAGFILIDDLLDRNDNSLSVNALTDRNTKQNLLNILK